MAEINYANPINRWLKYHQVTPARKLYRSSQVANERLAIKQPFWIHQMAGTLNNSQSVSQVSDSGETAVELLWTERRNGHKAAGEFQLLIQQGRRTLKGPSSHIITASARVAHHDYLICISNPSIHPSDSSGEEVTWNNHADTSTHTRTWSHTRLIKLNKHQLDGNHSNSTWSLSFILIN